MSEFVLQSYLGVNECRVSLGADFCLSVWPLRMNNMRGFTSLNSTLSAFISLEGAVASARGEPRERDAGAQGWGLRGVDQQLFALAAQQTHRGSLIKSGA